VRRTVAPQVLVEAFLSGLAIGVASSSFSTMLQVGYPHDELQLSTTTSYYLAAPFEEVAPLEQCLGTYYNLSTTAALDNAAPRSRF
jgi:hypothetical protein